MKSTMMMLLVLLTRIVGSKAMNFRSIEVVKLFLESYQNEKNISCTINFLDTFLDFGLVKDEKFQFTNGLLYHGLGSTCNILVCTEKYLALPESQKIDKEMKNHLWIIDGKLRNSLIWPVLEVTPKLTRLFCPGDLNGKLVTKYKSVPICKEYPTFSGKTVKVSVTGGRPALFKDSDGKSVTGFDPDSIDMLSEYIDYKPKYVIGSRNWDETVLEVNNGSADFGINTILTKKRYDKVDFPAYIDFTEVIYMAPIPKPVDILYQLIQPFSANVWLAWLTTLLAFSLLFHCITKLFLWEHHEDKRLSKRLKELKGIDLLLYPFGMLFESLLNDTKWIKILREKTASGKAVIFGLIIGGFLVMNLYRTVLLSYLAAISVEKPIDTVRQLIESDNKIFHFAGEITESLKDSPREEYRDLYRHASKNDWIVDGSRLHEVIGLIDAGLEAFMYKSFNYDWINSIAIKKTGKPYYRRIKEPLVTSMSSNVLPKNGPMTKTFEKYTLRAFDHGIFKKLKYNYQLRDGNEIRKK